MSNSHLAAPELAAIDVKGLTRSSFIMRSALAAGAVYGTSVVSPFVSKALAQENAGDVEILNFALTLEYLEGAFYQQAQKQVSGLDKETAALAKELAENEQEHVDALKQTIEQLGGKPVAQPGVDFGKAFSSQDAFLETAGVFEPVGVAAYNGAAPMIESKEVLGAAGSIVQIEGRHVALINLKLNKPITDNGAFSATLSMDEVLKKVKPFIKG